MKSEQERMAHGRFVQALQHEHLTCVQPGCGGAMNVTDHTPHLGRIKIYEAECKLCHTKGLITGKEQPTPPWDGASITMMAEVHLLHDQPQCPFDPTPPAPRPPHPHPLPPQPDPHPKPPLPPLLLLLRQTCGAKLAATGSQEVG